MERFITGGRKRLFDGFSIDHARSWPVARTKRKCQPMPRHAPPLDSAPIMWTEGVMQRLVQRLQGYFFSGHSSRPADKLKVDTREIALGHVGQMEDMEERLEGMEKKLEVEKFGFDEV